MWKRHSDPQSYSIQKDKLLFRQHIKIKPVENIEFGQNNIYKIFYIYIPIF